MSDAPAATVRLGPRVQGITLALLALLAMGPVLANSWVQDEGPLVLENARIHAASGIWTGFTGSWWPPETGGGLYRPLAQILLTLTWGAGGGAVWLFKAADLACYLFAVAGVWALARRLFPPVPAWVVAALFAVHPVHSEVVAVAVNQGESMVAGILTFATALWIDQGKRPSGRATVPLIVAALYLLALGFKEHALVLPALLIAAGIRRYQPSDPDLTRRSETRAAIAALAVVGALFWGVRAAVLGGAAGADPALGLPAEFGPRALTMLGVVPEWARLLLWPAELQADYAPLEIIPWAGWTTAQGLGVLVLFLWSVALAWSWRRRPVAAFGLLWAVIALAPVSNLVLPTGVLLAERTLMLASVGAIIAVTALIPAQWWILPRARTVLVAAIGPLLALGVLRSATRMPAWHDPRSYIIALAEDAPESSQSLLAVGTLDMETGRRGDGEARLRAVIAIAPGGSRAYRTLGYYYRIDGLCGPAIPLLERTIIIEPVDQHSRLGLVACLLDQGRYPEAHQRAEEGLREPGRTAQEALRHAIGVADSAARVRAPVGRVRLPPYPGGHTDVGPPLIPRGSP